MKKIKIKTLMIPFFFCSFQHVYSMDQNSFESQYARLACNMISYQFIHSYIKAKSIKQCHEQQQNNNAQQNLNTENENESEKAIVEAINKVKRSDLMLRKKIDELLNKKLPKDSTRIYKIIKSTLVDHPKIEELTAYMYDKFIIPQQQENYNPEIPQEKKQTIQNDDQETLLKKQNQKKTLKKRFTFLDKNLKTEKETITALLKGGKDCPTAKENYKALASFLHPDKVLISTLTSNNNFESLLNSNKIISFILHPNNKNKTNETLFKYVNTKNHNPDNQQQYPDILTKLN